MAWPYDCSGALSQIKYHTKSSFLRADDAITHKQAASIHWNLNQDHLAIEDILSALTDLVGAIKYGSFAYDNFYPYGALFYFLNPENENPCIGAPELTAEAICEAWAKDDFKGRAWTIAFIDRMRQMIWDEPFDVTWAAKPKI